MKNVWRVIMLFLYIISMGICFMTVSLFRPRDVMLFCGGLFVLMSLYSIVKKYPNAKSFSVKGKTAQLTIACILECLLFVDFSSYIIHVSPGILSRLPLPSAVSGIVISIVCCVFSFLFLFELAGAVQIVFHRIGSIFKSYKYTFFLLSGIYIVGMTAIIQADFAYFDDLARVVSGWEMMGAFSRHTATFLSNFMHGNSWLTDISPLPQIAAVLVMAMTGMFLQYILDEVCKKQKKFDLWKVIALVPLSFSPFFLQCLSYKYDSLYMAASVLFSVLPVVFYRSDAKKYVLAVIVSTILMCTTYQASSGIFPLLVALIVFLMWNQKEDLKKIGCFILHSVCGYVSGLLIFRFFIMTEQETYVDTSLSLQSVGDNLATYFDAVMTNFTPVWLSLIAVTCIVFVIVVVKQSQRRMVISLPVALLSLMVMAVLSFGAYVIFSQLLHCVRAMYGICVCFTLLGLVIVTLVQFPAAKVSVLLFSWLMFVFTFTYGNALAQQKEYTDFRLQEVIFSIGQIDRLEKDDTVYVQITGSIGYCDSVENMISEYPVLEQLVPVGFHSVNNEYGYARLETQYKLDLTYDPQIDMTGMDMPVVSDTVYHTIKSKDNYILICLK